MRRITAALLCGTLMFNSGCGMIRDELRHPGGYTGSMLDHTFDASRSKQLQLLRASLMIAIAARIGESTVEPEDGDAFARLLAEATREVNFAAADAGFGTMVDDRVIPTCSIEAGTNAMSLDEYRDLTLTNGVRADATILTFAGDDTEECAGYYVNFESHVTRIEGRVVRAMLTALPTDKARDFLKDVGTGNVLNAMLSLLGSVRELAGAFHNAAAVYRSGTEVMAASMTQCDSPPDPSHVSSDGGFRQEYDTVMAAAACLGLSRRALHDPESADAFDFPNRFDVRAFHALFRIARAACIEIPLVNSTDTERVLESRQSRRDSCGAVAFKPQMRPLTLVVPAADSDDQAVTEETAEEAPRQPVAPQDDAATRELPAIPGLP